MLLQELRFRCSRLEPVQGMSGSTKTMREDFGQNQLLLQKGFPVCCGFLVRVFITGMDSHVNDF